jgi:hypothetical protein
MYNLLQNDTEEIKEVQGDYMTSNGMFSSKTAGMLKNIHIDLVGKILKNICKVYHSGIDRYLVKDDGDIDEEQTELLNEVYKQAGVGQCQIEWYRAAKFMNIVEVKPVWRTVTDQLEFDIWTPNFFTVWSNFENVYYKDLIAFDILLPQINGEEVDAMEVWTKDEHYYMVATGTLETTLNGVKEFVTIFEKKAVSDDNLDMLNPYKVIPSQELRFNKGQDYYGIGMMDLTDQNIWHDIEANNNIYVRILQGLGIIYAINFGTSEQIPLTPGMILTANNVKPEQVQPSIESVATQAPLTELDLALKTNYERIANLKGLSAQTATENTNAPGISKALDMEELELQQQEDKITLIDFEEKLYKKVLAVYNYHAAEKLNENLTFKVNFIEKTTPLNESDKVNKWTFELEQGLKSKVDYLQAEDPDLTTEQAIKQLEENAELKARFKTESADPNTGTGFNNTGNGGNADKGNQGNQSGQESND